jgi:glycosyltransferase involved in cell wall biosynthesis
VNSTYTKRQLELLAPEACRKTKVIPMGINPQHFEHRSAGHLRTRFLADHIILNVGRLIDIKGTIFLIRAMPEILSHFPGTLLLIAGDGPERERLYRESIGLSLEKSVLFLGSIKNDEIPNFFALADIFVLPSISIAGQTEAQGIVILEAMAAGCPVIGSRIGGIPDMINDGENGFLVPERDPGALAGSICRVLSDRELQEKFRRNGQLKVLQSFTWDIIADQFSALYHEVAGETLG